MHFTRIILDLIVPQAGLEQQRFWLRAEQMDRFTIERKATVISRLSIVVPPTLIPLRGGRMDNLEKFIGNRLHYRFSGGITVCRDAHLMGNQDG